MLAPMKRSATRLPTLELTLAACLLALAGCDGVPSPFGNDQYVVLDDARGLAVGNQVRVHGVADGRVTEVSIQEDGAHVVFEFNSRHLMRADACGEPRRDALGGEVYLHIDKGRSPTPWEPPLVECAHGSAMPGVDQALSEMVRRLFAPSDDAPPSAPTNAAPAPAEP